MSMCGFSIFLSSTAQNTSEFIHPRRLVHDHIAAIHDLGGIGPVFEDLLRV